ncbi:hypothetical protein BDP81DRAFT_35328 [Colletotrichum phormii]|uniref:NACHT-NTPase and P-loop NTPases N-terminal domain-containing protein n=1 Tax=Colletotrichum phormii TaxID=359342 RepID=A0AAI9ZQZ1_9PEZI|nr:uncharacterized protein BDP81DRAFT_35328 [Colletotrichum phormii]KAK1636231.1 hypothetical protein BDP81DRAFT_35328 [Colletotrichum phormii]
MAEALSLAASVIAVVDITAKVSKASIKLVNLWKEIKNVPDALLEKAERLKDFEDFLLETESQAANSPIPQQAWNSALLQKHIARTRTVLKDLQENVDRLHAQVTDPRRFKRKLASTRTVLRKEDISVLDSKLDVALELFRLAREQYLTSLMSYSVMVQLQQASELKSIQMLQTKVAILTEAEESPSNIVADDNDLSDDETGVSRSFVATVPVTSSFSHKPTMIGRLRLSWRSNFGFQLHAQPPSWLMGSVYSVLA